MTTATSAWRPKAVGMAADNDVGPGVVDAEPRVVVPPINFSLVAPGIYRSGHPNKKNVSFLRRLKLKSVMYLESTDEYRKDSKDFVDREGIELFRIDLAKEDVSALMKLYYRFKGKQESTGRDGLQGGEGARSV